MNFGNTTANATQPQLWKENPFSLKIMPELFVGYSSELATLVRNAQNNEKVTLLIGPTGAGKTTLLKKMSETIKDNYLVLYITKPPQNPEDFVQIFKSVLRPSFFDRLLSRDRVTLYELPTYVNKKLKNRKMVLLVDECHEASLPVLEWLRTIADQVNNISVVIAGLSVLETVLEEKLETLLNRVTSRVELTSLSREEVEELVKKRIEFAGGTGTVPFSKEALDIIYQKTGGFPRNVLKMCDDLMREAAEKKIQIIDAGAADAVHPPEISAPSANFIESLPEKQKEILKFLSEQGPLNPSEIAAKIGLEDYKSEDHASRSVNNILRRLMDTDCILREKRGKGFVYKISPKVRTITATT